ncbi:uncharacterized protein LAJ45_02328 [Morchella importuna]|uniref:uncharacterized protein n=1 Tax=Morchella importuna TaxID=1174673 RepID=UPI001E8D29D1|nr:uncharacterized protein LAJ45_02328 [Morchella importuna]KAH8153515.1 hypothetical protein LAJ45_02328 [Morchella importuna]
MGHFWIIETAALQLRMDIPLFLRTLLTNILTGPPKTISMSPQDMTTQRGAQLQLTVRTARTANRARTIISESLPEDKALPVPYLPPRGVLYSC